MKRVATYVRVSTASQTTENQCLDLEKWTALRSDWTLVSTFDDSAVSGTCENRPALDAMLADARRGAFDLLLVWKIDRLGRSVKHLLEVLSYLDGLGIGFASFSEGIDTTTPAGRMLFTVIGALAEFERSIIVERVHAGLRRARDNGTTLGRRPIKVDEERLLSLRRDALSIRQIAAEMGISKTTVAKRLKRLQVGPRQQQ